MVALHYRKDSRLIWEFGHVARDRPEQVYASSGIPVFFGLIHLWKKNADEREDKKKISCFFSVDG